MRLPFVVAIATQSEYNALCAWLTAHGFFVCLPKFCANLHVRVGNFALYPHEQENMTCHGSPDTYKMYDVPILSFAQFDNATRPEVMRRKYLRDCRWDILGRLFQVLEHRGASFAKIMNAFTSFLHRHGVTESTRVIRSGLGGAVHRVPDLSQLKFDGDLVFEVVGDDVRCYTQKGAADELASRS